MQMKLLKVFLTFQCLVATTYALYRIVGGKEVKIDNFPYQLSLRMSGSHICGAALISEKYALSAAHCFTTQGSYSVRAGSDKKDDGGVVTNVKNAFLHPERASHKYQYDIAILELFPTLPLTDKIKPIKLPDNDDLIKTGVAGIISGFGDTYSSENTGSEHLRAAEVIVEEKNWCQDNYRIYGLRLSRMVFCAGMPQGERDSCQGDSGGPFVIDDVLYGIVSYGVECGDPSHPGVYTNIAAFRDFIRVNTGL